MYSFLVVFIALVLAYGLTWHNRVARERDTTSVAASEPDRESGQETHSPTNTP